MNFANLLDEVPGVRGSAPPLEPTHEVIRNLNLNSRQGWGRAPHSRDFVKNKRKEPHA